MKHPSQNTPGAPPSTLSVTPLAVLLAVLTLLVACSSGTSETPRGQTRATQPGPTSTRPPPTGAISTAQPPTSDPPTTPSTSQPTSSTLELVARLTVAPERPRSGYDRELFEHWVDADGDECDTRCEVLTEELRTDLPGQPGWYSSYDGVVFADPRELDVDHVVALAEAWDSGADTWSPDRRRAFANDVDEPRALTAVSARSNRAKSDQDPTSWRPTLQEAWCAYALDWVVVKLRWGLSADPAEVAALTEMATGCASTPPGGGVVPPPPDTPTPTAPDLTVQPGSMSFASCTAARAAGAAPVRRGEPGYSARLDGDGDGVGCE